MIVINPLRATLNPSQSDDQIINGLQFVVDANSQVLTIDTGRIRLNGLYMDLDAHIESDLSAAPMGRSLMALDETLTLRFLDDNTGTFLVIGIVDKRNVGGRPFISVIPVVYILGGQYYQSVVQDIFSPSVSIETQIKMLFEELAYNKMRDAELKYEEMLESLPEFNSMFIEGFKDTSFFYSNELAYNSNSKSVALGLLPPYAINQTKTLIERAVLPSNVSRAYFAADVISNGETYSIRLSFDGGANWVTYVKDDFYTSVAGKDLLVEIKLSTRSSLATPLVRSWALFYTK